MSRFVAGWMVAAVVGAGLAGAEEDIHLPQGSSPGTNWTVTDSAGYQWDIAANGQVNDGTNDAFDGGMQLRVGSAYFASPSITSLSKDGREVEMGPWTNEDVRVWRRVYVDAQLGYARWIDIFENTSAAAKTLAVKYYSNVGDSTALVYSTSGKEELTDKDWGVVTGYSASSSRPSIVHVFATKASRIKPAFQFTKGNDNLYLDVNLKLVPGKPLALCIFVAQRHPHDRAKEFLDEFKPNRELTKVPAALRRILANMGGAMLVLGNIDLLRHEKHDLAVLRNENELLGEILNRRFDVETFYGKLELPAGRVVGLNVPARDDPYVQVILVDGQVVSGRLIDPAIHIRLTNGNEMSLPPERLASATFAVSDARPEEIKITRPTVVLRSGQQLAFDPAGLDCTFHTQCGDRKLDVEDLQAVHLDTPEGGLHRAVFRSGSVLSGLLTAERLKLTLDLGPVLDVARPVARDFIFPTEAVEADDLAEATLRNDDHLFGRIVEDSLIVETRFGKVTVKPGEIAELQTAEAGTLGQVRIKLHSGTTITGRLTGDVIRFQMRPGPLMPIFIGHLSQITCPGPRVAGGATTAPAGATTAPTAAPAAPKGPEPAPPPPPPGSPPTLPPGGAASGATVEGLQNQLKTLQRFRQTLDRILSEARATGKPTAAHEMELQKLQERTASVQSRLDAARKAAKGDK